MWSLKLKIFYSWQSDTPAKIGKYFIRKSIDEAVEKLKSDVKLEEANRNISVEQDTENVLGSPPVAETIFAKIRNANIIITDITLTGTTPSGKKLSNSNATYEHAYAHGHHGYEMLLPIMNTFYGTEEERPFDFQQSRWPVTFRLSNDASKDEIAAEQTKLARKLYPILKAYLKRNVKANTDAAQNPKSHIKSTSDPARFWQPGEIIAKTERHGAAIEWRIPEGLIYYIRVKPTEFSEKIRLNSSSIRNSVLDSFRPIGRHGSLWVERNAHGLITISGDTETGNVWEFCQLFKNGEIWAGCTYMLNQGNENKPKSLPTQAYEEVFIRSLRSYFEGRSSILGLSDPAVVELGLIAANDYYLAVSRSDFWEPYWGPIFEETITVSKTIENTNQTQINEVLTEFFEEICEAAGKERPINWYGFPEPN